MVWVGKTLKFIQSWAGTPSLPAVVTDPQKDGFAELFGHSLIWIGTIPLFHQFPRFPLALCCCGSLPVLAKWQENIPDSSGNTAQFNSLWVSDPALLFPAVPCTACPIPSAEQSLELLDIERENPGGKSQKQSSSGNPWSCREDKKAHLEHRYHS